MEAANENEPNISEEQMKAEPNTADEPVKAESNTADEPVKAESNTADEPVKAESNTADEPVKAESNTADEPVKAESNTADEPVKAESNTADEPVKAESNTADEPVKAESNNADEQVKAESNIADEPTKAESNNADEPVKAESKIADEPTKAESNNADEPVKAESNNADEPVRAESNIADEPVKAESNNADEPVKAESNIADEPTKAESNNADEPMKAESNNADEPVKAESNIADEPTKAESNNADEPMEAESNNADEPVKAESNIADEPTKAESNNADEPMETESNNADEPVKAESNIADEPTKAESNNADEPMEAESNNADEPMKAESNIADEPVKVQSGDSSALESETNEQKPTSTDAPSGNATCSLTLDSDVKEHIEPKLIETLAQTSSCNSTPVTVGEKRKRPRNLNPPDCIIILDSSSDDELAPSEAKVQVKSHKEAEPKVQVKSHKEAEPKVQVKSHKEAEPKVQVKSHKEAEPKVQVKSYKEVDGYVIIDSDSDDDCPAASKEEKTEIEKEDLNLKAESVPSSGTILIDDEDDDNAQDILSLAEELSDQKGPTNTGSDSNSSDSEKPCQSSSCALSKDFYSRLGNIYKECRAVPKESRKRKTKTIVTTAVKPPKKKCRRSKKSSAQKEEHENKDANCNIPGCFLRGIENEKRYSGKNFKRNRDELVQKIYALFNRSVFDNKLPEDIEIKWNNKMLRTAGLCTTCRTSHPKNKRYATIDIALKICDSADRLRDILIHEMCHVASWVLDGIHCRHGKIWKYYAKMSNMVHPELPKITRCHNYKINYKVYYECTRCKSRVGRHSKSLNTDRFICGNCWGPLVLVPLTRKDGTPIIPHVRPFAKYVKEHYRVLKDTTGICHKEVMRELSKTFLAKKQMNNP